MSLLRKHRSGFVRAGPYWAILLLLMPSLLLTSCGADTPEQGPQLSPLATEQQGGGPSVLRTATLRTPTEAPASPTAALLTATEMPALPTATPVPPTGTLPVQLLLLHTNDNWGETEPCG